MDRESLPKGLIIDVITPLLPDGNVDMPTFSRHIETLSTATEMLIIGGPRVGEGTVLEIDKRLQLLRVALASSSADVILLFYITSAQKEAVLETVSAVGNLSIGLEDKKRIVLLDSPLLYHSNRNLPEFYSILCGLTELSFVLLNDPELIKSTRIPFKRSNIRTKILKELSAQPAIKGIVCYGPFGRIRNYEKAGRCRPDFRVYDGEEMRFLDYPNKSGVVSITANFKPHQWREIVDYSLGIRRFISGNDQAVDYYFTLFHKIRSLKDLLNLSPRELQALVLTNT